jgi:hypothetical protein
MKKYGVHLYEDRGTTAKNLTCINKNTGEIKIKSNQQAAAFILELMFNLPGHNCIACRNLNITKL